MKNKFNAYVSLDKEGDLEIRMGEGEDDWCWVPIDKIVSFDDIEKFVRKTCSKCGQVIKEV